MVSCMLLIKWFFRPRRYCMICGLIFHVCIITAMFSVLFLQPTFNNRKPDRSLKWYKDKPLEIGRDLSTLVTVIIREFEMLDNDIYNTLTNLYDVLPRVSTVIVSDSIPYPPLELSDFSNKDVIPQAGSIKVVTLNTEVTKKKTVDDVFYYVETPLVLILPDGARVLSDSSVINMITVLLKLDSTFFIAAPMTGESLKCLSVDTNLKQWTLSYTKSRSTSVCDAVEGRHVLLMHNTQLQDLSLPFTRPFHHALYIQTAAIKLKVHILYSEEFNQSINKDNSQLDAHYKQYLYSQIGIKKVELLNGSVEYYGCRRDTGRCFGSVYKDTPSYLVENRWTPPCCLEALRVTSRHVFSVLDNDRVRYWLEGGSLLGAVRYQDIIPWDYDVDIGIYMDDIAKSPVLKAVSEAKSGTGFLDNKGFFWEKAQKHEGDFLRVHYSQHNRLHVDIFPFYSRDGVMTKDYWMPNHPQDCEFPEHYLKPLNNLLFLGYQASVPNHVKEFIELKFGVGAIENPQYPDPDIVEYTNASHGFINKAYPVDTPVEDSTWVFIKNAV